MTLATDIRAIQHRLSLAEDGVFGPVTARAVLLALDRLAVSEGKAPIPAQGGSGTATGGRVKQTGLRDPGAFYAALRGSFGGLVQSKVDGFNALLAATGTVGWPVSWVAYALATAWHETAHTMQPVKEYGGTAYYTRLYDIAGQDPARARRHGNTSPGDGARYCGRGYVQLTWKNNYANAGNELGLDLAGNPDLAMKPDVAARILTWGMAGGEFTGKALKDYLPASAANVDQFAAARRIINGTDKARTIADIAMKMQAALVAGGWS